MVCSLENCPSLNLVSKEETWFIQFITIVSIGKCPDWIQCENIILTELYPKKVLKHFLMTDDICKLNNFIIFWIGLGSKYVDDVTIQLKSFSCHKKLFNKRLFAKYLLIDFSLGSLCTNIE